MKNQNTYDANFKRIIANKSLLCYILKTFVDEYKEVEESEIRELLNVNLLEDIKSQKILSLQKEFKDEYGKIELDQLIGVKLPDQNGQIGIFINFEMQRSVSKDISILPRAIYYVAKVITMQKESVFKHMEYSKLLKVYGIWIVMIGEEEANSLNRYRSDEYRVLGNYHEEKKDYDKSEIVVMRLGNEEEERFDVLNTLFVKEGNAEEKIAYLKDKYGIDLEENKEEVEYMCTPDEFFEARYKFKYRKEGREEGKAAGLVEGKAAGLVEGKAAGLVEGKAESVRLLMKNMKKSFEEVTILLEIMEEEKEEIRRLVFS